MNTPLLVDTHVHLYRTSSAASEDKENYSIWEYGEGGKPVYSSSLGSPEELVRSMEEAGISHVAVLNLFIAEWEVRRFEQSIPECMPPAERQRLISGYRERLPETLRDFNLWGCAVAAQYSGITPFVSVDLNVMGADESVAMVRDLVENHGARGLKLHSAIHRHAMSDVRLRPLFALCCEYRLPVLGHAGLDPARAGFAEPNAFAPVLEAFPELQLIVAHMGGGAWQQTAELAERYPNAWFDCAEIIEWTDASAAPSDAELVALIRRVGSHRVLMGSDYPWYDLDRTVSRMRELPRLSDEELALILGHNAVRLLDIRG